MKYLYTDRLTLRPFAGGDYAEAKQLYQLASDPKIGPLCGWPPHGSIQESAQVIDDIFLPEGHYAITLSESEVIIGVIGLKLIKQNEFKNLTIEQCSKDSCASTQPLDATYMRYANMLRENNPDFTMRARTIGYWLGTSYQGFGYMTEALNCLISHAFTDLSLCAVIAVHYVDNYASERVMQRCAMRTIGTMKNVSFPLIKEQHDEVAHMLNVDDWRASRAS